MRGRSSSAPVWRALRFLGPIRQRAAVGQRGAPTTFTAVATEVVVRVLGAVSIERTDRTLAPGLRRLLAILTAHRRHVVSNDALIEWCWPQGPPGGDGKKALRTSMSRLRTVLGQEWIVTEAPGYRLTIPDGEIDIGRFEADLAVAAAQAAAGELAAIDDALALWRGQPWQEFADEEWARGESVRLSELRALAEERRLELLLELGRAGEAAADAEGFIDRHPYREVPRLVLMKALAATGRDAEALRSFQAYREAMADAGLDVSDEMRALEARVVVGDRQEPASAERSEGRGWLPTPPRTASGFAFVGRDEERTALMAAVASTASVVLVEGEPGVGKSRLVAETVADLAERGDLVLVGRCSEDLAAPYLPLSMAFSGIVELAPPSLVAEMGRAGGDLVGLLLQPDRDVVLPPRERRVEADAATTQFRLLEAVRAWLTRLTEVGRVLLVIDDLQWADSSTVAILRDVLCRRPISGVVVVATARDGEIESDAPVASLILDVDRLGCCRRLALGGLSEQGCGDLVEAAAGGAVGNGAPEVTELVFGRSAGNPLFASQILRDLVDSGVVASGDGVWTLVDGAAIDHVPTVVRAVVDQRVARLGGDAECLLDGGAIAGATFDLALVAPVVGLELPAAIAVADRAVAAGLLIEDPTSFGRYGFLHAVLRDARLAGQSSTRRVATSWRLGEEMERAAGAAAPARAEELARLYLAGVGAGDPLRAATWSFAAGVLAYDAAAFVEACRHADDVLELLARCADADERRVVEALALKVRALRRHGSIAEVIELASAALDRAIALGDAHLIADVAAGEVGPLVGYDPWYPTAAPIEQADRALAALPPEARAARAKVTAAKAFWLQRANDIKAVRVAEVAVEEARDMGDTIVLATTIATVLHAYLRARHGDLLARRTGELEHLVDREGLDDLRSSVLWGSSFGVIRSGDMAGWAALADAQRREAQRVGWNIGIWLSGVHRVFIDYSQGRVDGLEAVLDDLVVQGAELDVPSGFVRGYVEPARLMVMLEQGRLDACLDRLSGFLSVPGSVQAPTWQAGRARLLCEAGRPEEARADFEAIAADGFDGLDAMAALEANVAAAVVAAEGLGERWAIAPLRSRIEGTAGQLIYALAPTSGPVDLWLARASVAAGELDRALEEFAAAEAMCERASMDGCLARTRLHRAQLHRRAGRAAAADLDATRALATAERLGLAWIADQAESVLASL